ncbi:hypothetical protein FRC04_004621 [Tulasnella sp. 424]|nr:hypothetical protein FRC04_004621 [Tulasnella sp. 424]KAG8972769.1 hypothetical protein FRC05_009599 [Tulasnella sp. 425]
MLKRCKCAVCSKTTAGGCWLDARTYRQHRDATAIESALPLPGSSPSKSSNPNKRDEDAGEYLHRSTITTVKKLFDDLNNYLPHAIDPTSLVFAKGPIDRSLDPSATENAHWRHCQTGLRAIRQRAERVDTHGIVEVEELRSKLCTEVDNAIADGDTLLRMEWNRRHLEDGDAIKQTRQQIDTSLFRLSPNTDIIVLAVGLVIAVLHFVYNVAISPCNLILRCIAIIVSLSSQHLGGNGYNPRLPTDLRTILSSKMGAPIPTSAHTPISEKHAELILPGMEELLDKGPSTGLGTLRDIRDGCFAAEFCRADGEILLGSPGGIMLALGVDWFNPFGNRQSKKKRSVGGMYLCVQNLPIELRHRPENICVVGLIPGPFEPSQVEAHINHFLRPLVDELLELYDPGIQLSSTPAALSGRDLQVALGQVIADTQASHALGGFTPITHTIFCTVCDCQKGNLHHFNCPRFTPRNSSNQNKPNHRECATLWRDAESLSARQEIEKRYGARWTELYRLPYWDSTRQLVIDPMHLFSGSLKNFCRDVWGMNVKSRDDDGLGIPSTVKIPTTSAMAVAQDTLLTKSMAAVRNLGHNLLQMLAFSLGYPAVQLTSKALEKCLAAWRFEKGIVDEDDQLVQSAELQELLATLLPSDPSIDITAGEKKLVILRADHRQMMSLTLRVLREMCRIRSIPTGKDRKEDLVVKLLKWRHENVPHPSSSPSFPAVCHPTRRTGAVLGQNVLAQVRNDIRNTTFPSHIRRTPENLGRADHGKLTAEEWFSTCWYSLAITLPRIWSAPTFNGNEEEQLRRVKMLRHFSYLVGFTKLALGYVITPQDIKDYKSLVMSYLSGLSTLYDWVKFKPQHHLLLHIPDFAFDLGPTFSWSAWYTELMNGLIQDIPTNSKFGELEGTMFDRINGLCQIKARLLFGSLPEPLTALRQVFATAFGRVFPSMLMSEWDPLTRVIGEWVCQLAPTPTELDDGRIEWELIRTTDREGSPHIVTFCRTVQHQGVTYRPQNGTTNIDSYVEVLVPERGYFTARIESIFTPLSGSNDAALMAVVSLFKPLNRQAALLDPYKAFPHLGARLIHDSFLPEKVLIPLTSIFGPVVICPFTSTHPTLVNTLVVVSASRKSK